MIFFKLPLHVLVAAYGCFALALAVYGSLALGRRKRSISEKLAASGKRFSWEMTAAILLILLQVAVLVFYAHMDADDSFYVGTATTAVETDTIFEVNPYTGALYQALPRRYVLSPFPVFLAVVSRLCAGLHPAIVAHTVFSAVFLFLVISGIIPVWAVASLKKIWRKKGCLCSFAVSWSGFQDIRYTIPKPLPW